MKLLLIEDEPLAAERLHLLLRQYDPEIQVLACLESIDETVQYLKTRSLPDLLLMDIHLSDGYCFEIFRQVQVLRPVIFTTAFDHYAIQAFQHLSVDYLLKPISAEALSGALNKYREMAAHFAPPDYARWQTTFREPLGLRYKDRFMAKVGNRTFIIQSEDIAYFTAENKVVTMADKNGNRYAVNYTIEKLEPLLDPHHFFRINRKMIVHSKVIEQVKPYFNSRLKLLMKGNVKLNEEVVISRERVSAFKRWAEG